MENKVTEKKEIYPSAAQGFGVIGIMLLLIIPLTPVKFLLDMLGNSEFSSFVYYVALTGTTFLIINRKRKRINGINDKVFNLKVDNLKTVILLAVITLTLGIGFIAPVLNIIPMSEWWVKILEKLY